MLTKTPDYYISSYGCPQWRNNENLSSSNECFALKSSPQRLIRDKSKKLLPLRETLNDYYQQLIDVDRCGHGRLNAADDDDHEEPAQLKTRKHRWNEDVKRKERFLNSSNQSVFGKSTNSRTTKASSNSTKSRTALVTTTDSDADGF